MSSCVYYVLSHLNRDLETKTNHEPTVYKEVHFEGPFINVGDFQRKISETNSLFNDKRDKLIFCNSQTKHIYPNDNSLIEKHSTVIVSRMPISTGRCLISRINP